MELKEFLMNIFSITDYGETHHKLTFLGIKLKYPRWEYYLKKKENIFYYYKKHNKNITELPPATGQIRDIQLANLALLDELDYVCRENNIKYWLDAGTLIGAIRHKGFIPWDDDIDTAMLREDYNKIIDAFKKSSRDSNIFAEYSRSQKNTCQCIIKIQHKKCPHLFVDIFPFDFYAERHSNREQLEKTIYIRQLRKKMETKCTKKTSDKDIINIINTVMKKKVLVNSIPEDKTKCELVWGLDFNHSWDNWFTNYDVLFPLSTIEFEGKRYPCMNNPDAFLTRVYGNYMAYPKNITMGHSMLMNLSKKDKEIILDLKNRVKDHARKK